MANISQAVPVEALPRAEITSADDWLALPDGHHHELVAGRLTVVPSTDLRYDLIASDLSRAVGRIAPSVAADGMNVRWTGFVVSAPGEDETVLVPALAFLSAKRLARVPPITAPLVGARTNTLVRVAPDLVVEIASPSQRESELTERVRLWRLAGVRLVWVVWPARRQIAVWTLDGAEAATATAEAGEYRPRTLSAHDTLDGGEILTGFAYTVAHLFL